MVSVLILFLPICVTVVYKMNVLIRLDPALGLITFVLSAASQSVVLGHVCKHVRCDASQCPLHMWTKDQTILTIFPRLSSEDVWGG